jgi:hypothetical protein
MKTEADLRRLAKYSRYNKSEKGRARNRVYYHRRALHDDNFLIDEAQRKRHAYWDDGHYDRLPEARGIMPGPATAMLHKIADEMVDRWARSEDLTS